MFMSEEWVGIGKVRAREAGGVTEIVDIELTTQAKYYKPLIYEFFRKEWRGSRPAWGEFEVEIGMHYVGDPPWMPPPAPSIMASALRAAASVSSGKGVPVLS